MAVHSDYIMLPNGYDVNSSWRNACSPTVLESRPETLPAGNFYNLMFFASGTMGGSPIPSKLKIFMPPGTKTFRMSAMFDAPSGPQRVAAKMATPPTTDPTTFGSEVNSLLGPPWTPTTFLYDGLEILKWSYTANNVLVVAYGGFPHEITRPASTTGSYVYFHFAYPDDRVDRIACEITVQADIYRTWWNRIHVWDGLGFPREDIAIHTGASDPALVPPEGIWNSSIGVVVDPLEGIRVEPAVVNVRPGELNKLFVYPIPPTALLDTCSTTTPALLQLAEGIDANPRQRQTWMVVEPAGSSLPAPVSSSISCGAFTAPVTINPPGEVATVTVTVSEDPVTSNATFHLTTRLGRADVDAGGTVTFWVSSLVISEDFFGISRWRFMAKDPITGERTWRFQTSADRSSVAYERDRPITSDPMVDDVVAGFPIADIANAKIRLYFGYELNNSGTFVNLGVIWASESV